MPATTSPLLSSFHSYDFSFSLSSLLLSLASVVGYFKAENLGFLRSSSSSPSSMFVRKLVEKASKKQLLSSFCDDEKMPATTSPLLSSFHSYDFSFSLSSGSLWLAFSQPLCGWLSLNLSVAVLEMLNNRA
ncbi:hypothetical protein L3X38_003428 [Prunus dulcis]|uniref:Uncharacterized protein n=1 Tax=Prunus dulcis TaxID=3755 RepID=A0AAD4VKP7_PRUDU|nr:hypothetical protein L3X38_034770 [Prunus dulcis]KAI5350537.1 hypothetical protein L3X38_003428 [Prunus dulcis]